MRRTSGFGCIDTKKDIGKNGSCPLHPVQLLPTRCGCRAAAAALCRSLGGIGKAAALQHLLRGVKLGWEFTPATAAAAPAAPTLLPTTTTAIASAGVPVSNGPSEVRHQGLQKPEEEEGEVEVEVQRKPTLLLLHGFMGSKVCCAEMKGSTKTSQYNSSPSCMYTCIPEHPIGPRLLHTNKSVSTDEKTRSCFSANQRSIYLPLRN